jgi:Leucine-rich repeat (LRR) protein
MDHIRFDSLPNIVKLTILLLNTEMKDSHFTQLATSVMQLRLLTYFELDLENTSLRDIDTSVMGVAIARLDRLQEFRVYLSRTETSDEGAACFMEGLTCLAQLRSMTVDLSYNGDFECTRDFGLVFGHYSKLNSLDLNLQGMQLVGGGTSVLGRSIGSLTFLQSLSLDFSQCNQIPDDVELVTELSKLTELRSLALKLADIKLTDPVVDAVNAWIQRLTNLRSLVCDFSGNLLSEGCISRFELTTGALPNLETITLDLRENPGSCIIYDRLTHRQILGFDTDTKEFIFGPVH